MIWDWKSRKIHDFTRSTIIKFIKSIPISHLNPSLIILSRLRCVPCTLSSIPTGICSMVIPPAQEFEKLDEIYENVESVNERLKSVGTQGAPITLGIASWHIHGYGSGAEWKEIGCFSRKFWLGWRSVLAEDFCWVQYMLGKFSRTLSPDVTSHLNGTIETQLWNRTAGRVPEFQGSVPFLFSGWATTGGTTPSARDGFNPTDTGAGNVSYLAWMILTSQWLVGRVITSFTGSHHMFFLWCHPCYSDFCTKAATQAKLFNSRETLFGKEAMWGKVDMRTVRT